MDTTSFEQRLREEQLQIVFIMEAVQRAWANTVEINANDAFAFTARSFLSKQMTHADSVLRLGDSLDTQLIARTMIEGFAQLHWIAEEPEKRATKWRSYAAVRDWLSVQRDLNNKIAVDDETIAKIKDNFDKYGGQFKKEVEHKLTKHRYDVGWTDKTIRQMLSDAGLPEMYRWYEIFSDWVHWNMYGVGGALTREGKRVVYSTAGSERTIAAHRFAFMCVLESAVIAVRFLDHESQQEILKVFWESSARNKE